MKIIVHFPKKDEDIIKLRTAVARMRADIIVWKVRNLNCTQSQKIKLLDGIIHDINAGGFNRP
jgi:hypothetical protein